MALGAFLPEGDAKGSPLLAFYIRNITHPSLKVGPLSFQVSSSSSNVEDTQGKNDDRKKPDNSVDRSGGEEEEEGAFSDQAHMRASMRLLDPSVIKTAVEEEADEQDDLGEEEHKLLTDVVQNLQEMSGTKGATAPSLGTESAGSQRQRRNSMLKSSLLNTFSAAEEHTVLKVLKEIETIQERHQTRGFKEINFTMGVANCFFTAYAFGRYPEHFWLIYLLQSLYFIPRKLWNGVRAKPLNETLYLLDFCWTMNCSTVLVLLLLMRPTMFALPYQARHFLALGSIGIACGPLLGATGLLPFVAFIFHDLNTMTNVVIHALPPMVIYTLRWHSDEIREAWPNVFRLQNLENLDFFPPEMGPFFLPGTGLESIAGTAVLIYFMWFIPYTSWMLLVGLDLPRKDRDKPPVYDTVFHTFWRVGACQTCGNLIWKRPVAVSQQQMKDDHYEVRDFLVYMAMHAVMVLTSIPTLAYACNSNKHVHAALIFVVLFISIHRGSQRYTYYSTKMYSQVIRKAFLDKPK